MDWKAAITKLALQLAISLLSKFVPFLGSLLGGPLGWLAGWLMGKAMDWLYAAIEQYLKFKNIDREVQRQLLEAQAATELYRTAQKTPDISEADENAALEKFRNSVRDLGRIRLQ